MKKNILASSVILLGLVFLSGCNKKETQNNNQASQMNQSQSSTSGLVEEVEVGNTEPLKGNDEVTNTINDVDEIIQDSDSDLDANSLSNSELQL